MVLLTPKRKKESLIMAQITSSEKAFIGVDIRKEEFFAFSSSLGSSPACTNNQVGFELEHLLDGDNTASVIYADSAYSFLDRELLKVRQIQ